MNSYLAVTPGNDGNRPWPYVSAADLTCCAGGKSHPQNRPAAAPAEPDIDSGANVTGSEAGAFCPVRMPYVVTTSGRSTPCQQPSSVAEPYPNWRTGPHGAAVALSAKLS